MTVKELLSVLSAQNETLSEDIKLLRNEVAHLKLDFERYRAAEIERDKASDSKWKLATGVVTGLLTMIAGYLATFGNKK